MQLINVFDFGGAESLALNICIHLNSAKICQTSVCALFGGRGPLVDHAENNTVNVHCFTQKNRGRLQVMWGLYRLFRVQHVTVVQVHGAYLLQYAALPARLAGVRIIYTEHAKYSLSQSSKLKRNTRYLSRLADKVVCVSENLKNFMITDVGVSASQIEVIHNGVNLSAFQVENKEKSVKKNQDKLIIGTVARLSEPKDHGNLLRAFAEVVNKRPDVRLMLVGDGELRSDIESMIQQLGLKSYVDMLGRRSDIPELLVKMDIFVLPSKREGFPIAVLEAMACGKPVVATNVGGMSEIISNGEEGMIVPPENSDELAKAILKLVADEGLRTKIAVLGYQKVISSFSEQAMMEKYMNLLMPSGKCHANLPS
nr:glycosyltransferase [Pelovirga terrestris]